MSGFQLFAHGEAFDVDGYLATASLEFDGAWCKGKSGLDQPKSNGVFKVLGDGRTLSIFEQERIAIEYLSINRGELKALAQNPEVTTFILGLQYHIELQVNTIGFSMGPSALLMWHALEIGVSPTYYVTLNRKPETEIEEEA